MHTYAIGDIHGHLDLLHHAHDLITIDQAGHGPGTIVHVGDLVDRGPHSAGVVDYLRAGVARGEDWVVLKGNHDRMFTLFLDDPAAQDHGLMSKYTWLHPKLGGATTLGSYGVKSAADRPVAAVHADAVATVPKTHRDFLMSRPTFHQTANGIFVHAGIRPGIPIAAQTETDLVWIRSGFLEVTAPHEALIVHGHTAIDTPTHYGNRLNVDSSAAYGGPLSAVAIEGADVFLLTRKGRVRVTPPHL